MELKLQDGSGEYHFNRYRIVCNKPSRTTESVALDFITNFDKFFFHGDPAKVSFEKRTFNNKPTLKFHGFMNVLDAKLPVGSHKLDIAAPHDDWVVREWVDLGVGFTGQTLKRQFSDSGDEVVAAVLKVMLEGSLPSLRDVPVLGKKAIDMAIQKAIDTNRMHFLAGRRSWRVGDGKIFDVAGDVLVLETVAVERFSALEFRVADAVAGLEKRIPAVWVANLTNFVKRNNFTRVPQPDLEKKMGWTNSGKVDYYQAFYPDLRRLQSDPEFKEAIKLFPSVLGPV